MKYTLVKNNTIVLFICLCLWSVCSFLVIIKINPITLLLYGLQGERQPHKMVKHTQTICRLWPTSCLGMFDRFVGSEFKWLIYTTPTKNKMSIFFSCETTKKRRKNVLAVKLTPSHSHLRKAGKIPYPPNFLQLLSWTQVHVIELV